MTSQPTSNHFDFAVESLLDWQIEARARNMNFYSNALVKNELTVIPGKEYTAKKSNCDVCSWPQKPGIRKFFYRESRVVGYQSFFCHLCDTCFTELVNVAPIQLLVIAQLSQTVTT